MRKIILLVLITFVIYNVKGQTSADVGKIALSVIMPDNVEGLDVSQLSKLETKITQIVTSSGIAASGYNHNFVIYPKFAIYETNLVEGGMQNITVSTCELSLFIKQVDNNILFSTYSKQLKGSGTNKQASITNAISKIATEDAAFKTFIATGKSKIVEYYELKCPDIVSQADAYSKMQDYEQALGLLQSVPTEVSCYNNIKVKSIEVYKAYQNARCSAQIQEAKTNLAANNFSGALNILSDIDPSTTCYKEAQPLITKAEAQIDVEQKKEWDLKMKIYDDAVALEKLRINAVKDIAVAYYKSKPTTVNYALIVK